MNLLWIQPAFVGTLLICLAANLAEAEVAITSQKAAELYAALPADDPWEKTQDASALAWGESHTLMALMNLYDGTGDVKYLAEVARRGQRMLTHRDDRRGIADGSGKIRPAWSMGRQYVVAQGKLVDPAGKPAIHLRSTPHLQQSPHYCRGQARIGRAIRSGGRQRSLQARGAIPRPEHQPAR